MRKLSRNDYNDLVSRLRYIRNTYNLNQEQYDGLVKEMIGFCAGSNELFDKNKFKEACYKL